MKIITVLVGDVFCFPPVLSLLHSFERMNIDSCFVTTKSKKTINSELPKTVVEELDINYESIKNPFIKMINIFKWRKMFWKIIDKYYDEQTIIWVITDVSIKILGNEIKNRKYIIHLLELSEKILFHQKLKFLKIDCVSLGNRAKAVIVPEYNRAHIIKAWWKLEKLPYIIPNKPFFSRDISKNSSITNDLARKIINEIGDKKIILYQGIIDPERPLGEFIDAVDEYNGKYAFVIMSGGKNIYADKKSDNYFFIPFVAPPEHLEITSHAHIGVLSYIPTYSSGYSPLNSLYCAPNKTFEYTKFSIPMIGNDIPGLRYLFETKDCGVCFESFTKRDICKAIDKIESRYDELTKNACCYYNECNYVDIVNEILAKI